MKLNRPGPRSGCRTASRRRPRSTRTTHLGIGAHQDDLEILAQRGILDCFDRRDRWFTAGHRHRRRGLPRSGPYADYTDDQMRAVRKLEQKKAGMVGDYSAVVLLDFTSADVKTPMAPPIVADLAAILSAARPEIVYTHNLADKHDTHVGTALRGDRGLPHAARGPAAVRSPRRRGLAGPRLDVRSGQGGPRRAGPREPDRGPPRGVRLADHGGKRYDLATAGRQRAHATYHQSHRLDATVALTFAMDLTPLVQSDTLDPLAYAKGYIERFAAEVTDRVRRLSLVAEALVDGVEEDLAVAEAAHVLPGTGPWCSAPVLRGGRRCGARSARSPCARRVVGRQRLLLEHVEGGRAHALIEGGQEGRLVHDLPRPTFTRIAPGRIAPSTRSPMR